MSAPLAIVLDTDHLLVVGAGPLARVPFDPARPSLLTAPLRAVVPRGGDAVLVVGAGVLEVAEPALPPVPEAMRLPLVRRESDRFLPLPAGAAVALSGRLALGVDGAALEAWVAAVETVLPVRAVVSLPQCAAWHGGDGRWSCPAAPGEVAEVTVRAGVLEAVRRRRAGAQDEAVAPPLPVEALARALAQALRRGAVPTLANQLLTPGLQARLARRQRTAWWRAAAVAACATVVLAGGADRFRARQLARLEAREQALLAQLEPARAAQSRVARAQRELEALDTLARGTAGPGAPLPVLAALGELLPRDAFVQRLEWDGDSWRLDGSARDAAALVPRLAADARFREVRTVAPSLRFLDNGVARSSFAIALRPGAVARSDPGTTGARDAAR